MSENTATARCTQAEWEASVTTGLQFADPGSTAYEIALHAFVQKIRAASWVHVSDKLPQNGQQVLLWVSAERHGENDDGYPAIHDESGVYMGVCHFVDGVPCLENFVSPFADVEVITHWMPLPGSPVQGAQ